MNRYYILIFSVLAALALFTNCQKAATGPNEVQVDKRDGGITIVDAEGVKWDVTHAEERYGMQAGQFQYGLGPNAITPLNNPQFYSPGDKDYPKNTDTFMILGVSIDGDSRAYPMVILSRHEVINDVFGDEPVAVTN